MGSSAARDRPTIADRAGDDAEVPALGGKSSTKRGTEQTGVARFWEYSLPAICQGVVRSVALPQDRDAALKRVEDSVREVGVAVGREVGRLTAEWLLAPAPVVGAAR